MSPRPPAFLSPNDAGLLLPARRRLLLAAAAAGGAAALGLPWLRAHAAASARAHDWDWLIGNWDVRHRRLRERLAGSDEWEEFGGKSAVWSTLGGLGTVDDNIVELPGGSYHGMSLRAYDAASDRWAIWWIDGRHPTRIDPPVRGGFDGDGGTFYGDDTFKGKPITMRFRWHDIHGAQPWWEQAFSPDRGRSWEVNWRNWFTRTAAQPSPLPLLPGYERDFDFLAGRWKVQHRRLRQRLVNSDQWDEFDGSFVNWPVLGGRGNAGDNVMNFPSGTVRGVGFRAYDPERRQWLSWWLDGRTPTEIGAPLRGGFADGVGTFHGDDSHQGRPVRTRVTWTHITARTARWSQSSSADGGQTWELNWVSDFSRV